MSATPGTIGALLRAARDRAVPKITQRDAAAAIGMNPDYWGQVERGDAQAPVATLARMFSVVPVAGDHREALERLRPEVAQALDAAPAPTPAGGDAGAEADLAMEKFIAERPAEEHEFLWFLWQRKGADMKLLPRAERMRDVFKWTDSHPVRPGPAATESSADSVAPERETG